MITTILINLTLPDDATDHDVAVIAARAMRAVAWQVEQGASSGSVFGKSLETIGMWFFAGDQDEDTAGAAAAADAGAGDPGAGEGTVTPASEGQNADPIETDYPGTGCQYSSAQAAASDLELSGHRQCSRRQRRSRE